MPQRRYPAREFLRRGEEWYERQIKGRLGPESVGKALIIDIETGEWEMDQQSLAATKRMLARKPDAQLYGMRVGYPAMGKRGGSWNQSARVPPSITEEATLPRD